VDLEGITGGCQYAEGGSCNSDFSSVMDESLVICKLGLTEYPKTTQHFHILFFPSYGRSIGSGNDKDDNLKVSTCDT
jgi:hypothetical protein